MTERGRSCFEISLIGSFLSYHGLYGYVGGTGTYQSQSLRESGHLFREVFFHITAVPDRLSRNPFVNQVICFQKNPRPVCESWALGRNPFVNQVICFTRAFSSSRRGYLPLVAIPS